MKTLQKVKLAFAAITIIAVFSSCQTSPDVKQVLSKPETRMMIMDSIANNSTMSQEMLDAMMKNNGGKMMMQGNGMMMGKMMGMMMENQDGMMKMMKDDPAMMQGMMSYMMGAEIMEGQKKMDGTGKMKSMDNMEGMDHSKTDKK